MRVALVLNSLGAGGTERSTSLLIPLLAERGVEPWIVCLERRDEGDAERLREAGFEIVVLPPGHRFAQAVALRSLLRHRRPALVHTAIFDADVVGRVAAAGLGIPVLSSLVNTPYASERLLDPNVTRGKLAAVRIVDAITARLLTTHFHAVTEGVAADTVRALGVPRSRVTVVERGRDLDELGRRTPARRQAARQALGLGDDAEVVLTVGRQEFQKGHVNLVGAVARLAERRPRLVGLVAGRTGNASDQLAAAIDRQGMGDRIRLLGHRDDVPDLLAAADVFALPSLYEGTAGAAIEALALEAPIVSTRLPGTAGVLDNEVALLVPPNDAAALAGAIDDALRDPQAARRRAVAGRQRVEERFTLEHSADLMALLYGRVAALPARPPALRLPRSLRIRTARGPS